MCHFQLSSIFNKNENIVEQRETMENGVVYFEVQKRGRKRREIKIEESHK